MTMPNSNPATLVYVAYGLTPGELDFLRDTRPIRNPLDVLEAKLSGNTDYQVQDESDVREIT